jgi:lipopolysaccharide transport system permease protein
VFGEIFQAKWNMQSSRTEFAMIVFCGLTTYNIFAEVIARSPNLIIQNTNYVKKVVFPLEVFPIIATGTALVNAMINFILLVIFVLFTTGGLSWTVLLLPFALLPVVLFTTGISWGLSALGVYIRDISHVIGISVQALMLLSPIFYSIDVIPDRYLWFYYINPITYFVEDMRSVLIWGEIPRVDKYLLELSFTAIVFVAGLIWFRKTKHGFADVV